MCHCGSNVKSAVAGNQIQVAVFSAVSPLPPELDNTTFSKDQTGFIRTKRPKPHSNHKQGKSKVRPT